MQRQIEVTQSEGRLIPLIEKGYTNKEIARELNLSTRTVDTHLSNIYRKANVSCRIRLVSWLKFNSIKVRQERTIQSKIARAHHLKSQGLTAKQISERMGVTCSAVYGYLKKRVETDKLFVTPCDFIRYVEFEIITCPPIIISSFWGAT